MHRARLSTPAWLALALTLMAGAQLAAQTASDRSRPASAVNLNTATTSQLEQLPGVGPRMAARIVEYRQKNGPFRKIEDLMNIRGIGEKNFLKLKPFITIGAASTSRRGDGGPR